MRNRQAYGIPPQTGASKASLRILAVEDDVLIQMTTTDMLSDLGHTVLEATNGSDALALLDAEDVDMLLTDVGLSGMSGLELAVSAVEKCPGLRVVFATGHSIVEGQDKYPQLDKAVVLSKPFDQDSLDVAIKAAG